MTTSKPRKLTAADTSEAVDRWFSENDPPKKDAIQALREVILGADPSIEEGVKWNSPSFRTGEYFATVNLRVKAPKGREGSPVAVILHLGAKKKTGTHPEIDDPKKLLEWLGDDRAMLLFDDAAQVKKHRAAVRAIVTQWVRAADG